MLGLGQIGLKVGFGGRGPPATSRVKPYAVRVWIRTNWYGATTDLRFPLHDLKRVEGDRDQEPEGGTLVLGAVYSFSPGRRCSSSDTLFGTFSTSRSNISPLSFYYFFILLLHNDIDPQQYTIFFRFQNAFVLHIILGLACSISKNPSVPRVIQCAHLSWC